MQHNALITVGKIGSSYGVKGWLKMLSYTQPVENLCDYQPWFLKTSTGWQEIVPADIQLHSKGLIVKFSGIDTPEEARRYTGLEVGVYRHNIPNTEAGEYYWMDLVGKTVLTQSGQNLGVVDSLLETGANDVLVCKGDKERLIPFIKDTFIISVNMAENTIIVDWDPDF